MDISWKVTHKFCQPIKYGSGLTEFRSLGATLEVRDSHIVAISQILVADDGRSLAEIKETSRLQIGVLVDWITFDSGCFSPVAHRVVERLDESVGKSGGASRTNFLTHTTDAMLTRPVRLPDRDILTLVDRLPIWLRLANEARDSESAVGAIRNYYMILEDMGGTFEEPSPENDLKCLRHFVSHAGRKHGAKVRTYLEKNLGHEATRYDPTDPTHQRFLRERRIWARGLIEGKIRSRLAAINAL